ncbi:4-hydroxy-3-methylbut-2-enyl diphosphate reductase [Catalinimonas alkaloidigena]|uniref:4-hydroxy-3-methylbut-2-enyl diphosphate reductase n=1 Tax=Catalinimonas alkaloidigena TaxID=1075417 RepID=UPI0024052154|nr:4-hydroxy-3-methylbut-2-enyl diphosphate reductase [Catalinimonas alkaloidigena]MDF9796871.1 4-hydroxy-3-methylbut-2-enyl diphosphate reductase [Catalinimonas alkaloidigena]
MLHLKVDIDQNSGFCFGVVYAIEMAEDILNEYQHLYCLGDIVHNDEEVRRLEKKGLKIINHDALRNLHNEKVLIRAHGEPPSTYRIALENKLELIDASCPVVLKLQNRIRNSYDKHEKIYIYGKHGHAEVEGLLGQTEQEAIVFQDINELNIADLPRNLTLYSQTTKSTDKFYEITSTLRDAGIEVNANDTICRQVSNRDKELRDFAGNYDVILFVSGTKSSNGKVLYGVCKDRNPNTYFISSKQEIDPDWFTTTNSVGICGATSTPMWLMEEVKVKLLSL